MTPWYFSVFSVIRPKPRLQDMVAIEEGLFRARLHPHFTLSRESREKENDSLKGEVSPNNNVDWVSRKQF